VIGLQILGAAAMPAANMHNSPPPLLFLVFGASCTAWLSPIYLIVFLTFIVRGHRRGFRTTGSEKVQASLFALSSATFLSYFLYS
jgi:hypothetical protein